MKRFVVVLWIAIICVGCGPSSDLRELRADPIAELSVAGLSVEERYETDTGSSIPLGKPSRARLQTAYAVDSSADPLEVWDAVLEQLEDAGWALDEKERPGQSPFATGTKEMPSGTAQVALNFGGHRGDDGEVIVEWDRLMVSVEHEQRQP